MAEETSQTLAGKRVVITRSAAQSEELARELSVRGAIPVVVPLVAFAEPVDSAPLDAAIDGIGEFEWLILTSAQAVRSMIKRVEDLKRNLPSAESKLRVAAVGPVTAEAARQAGFPVEYVAETHTGVALAEELGNRLEGMKVLLPRSDRANPELPLALKRHGAKVTEVIAYRTLRPTQDDEKNLRLIAESAMDAVLFFSPSAIHHFVELSGRERLRSLEDRMAIVAVGPVTAKALREAGVSRVVLATNTTAGAVIEALEKHFAGAGKAAPAGVKLR